MDNENIIYKHWQSERIIFSKRLLKLRNRVTVNAVHDIRVCIKKMKAYRKLFYLLYENKGPKIKFTETEKLFDILGRLRNFHICVQLISVYEKEYSNEYKELKIFFTTHQKQAKKWSKQALSDYNNKELQAFDSLIRDTACNQYDEERIQEEINSGINGLADLSDHPHRIRVLLKRFYYLIKILPIEMAEHSYRLDEITEVQDNLGQWQDNEILLAEIKNFKKKIIPRSFNERKLLGKLVKGIKDKKGKWREKAFNNVNHLIKNK